MSDFKKQNPGTEEHRNYFRVDDIISVVANPVHIEKAKVGEFRKAAGSSRAFSLMNADGLSSADSTAKSTPENGENQNLYSMISEIKAKLDFIINHFMLEKEGLLKPEKKYVNISASGVRFTIDYPVEMNEIMEIKLLLPTYPPVAVFAYGEVKRVKDLGNDKFEVAIEYLNMGDTVRNEIIQYTLSHQRETIRKIKESGSNE